MLAGIAAAASPLVWQPPIEVATGRGERGPWQQNESRYDYVDDATVALDAQGGIAVAWVDQGRKDVLLQRYAADGTSMLGEPVNVSRSPSTFSWLPRLVIGPRAPQQVFVLWQEIIFSGGSHGGDILFARSQDGGATFGQPLNLSRSVGGDGKGRINRDVWHNGSLDLVADDEGALYAAWTEYDGPLWFARSTDGGASFSRPWRIDAGSNAQPARAPALAVSPDRTVYLAWTVGENEAADIRVAVSSDGGASFADPRVVAPSEGYSDAPKIVVDPSGVLHLFYAEGVGGPFGRYHVRYTRSADRARTFDAPREISRAAAFGSRSSAAFPAAGIDASGNLYVIWELFADHRQPPRGLALAVSRDAGRSFSSPAAVPGSSDSTGGWNGSHQGLLMRKLAVNGAGQVSIVNSSLVPNERSRVWLMRTNLSRAH